MNIQPKIHTVRVFTNDHGEFGNPVGIILDDKNIINAPERQKIATGLGYSESVFINSLNPATVSIFNPQREIPFAGHAMLGTAWFINTISDHAIDSLTCIGGKIKTWKEHDKTWIKADLRIMPPWIYEHLDNPSDVENLSQNETKEKKHTYIWAWVDEIKGIVRARTFAPDWGIPEDEANGSGSMKLSAALERSLEILHGKGSVISVRPSTSDLIDLGGYATED